jgi:hypothetical protein
VIESKAEHGVVDKIPETLGMLVPSYRIAHTIWCSCADVDSNEYHTNVRSYDTTKAHTCAYVDVIQPWSECTSPLTTSKFTLLQLPLYMVIDTLDN